MSNKLAILSISLQPGVAEMLWTSWESRPHHAFQRKYQVNQEQQVAASLLRPLQEQVIDLLL